MCWYAFIRAAPSQPFKAPIGIRYHHPQFSVQLVEEKWKHLALENFESPETQSRLLNGGSYQGFTVGQHLSKEVKSLKEAVLAFSEQNQFCFSLENHFKLCL